MAKKSIVSVAQDTMVEAAKTGVAVARLAATAGLAAGGPVAAGVVLDSVAKGLQRAERNVQNVTPGEVVRGVGVMPSPARKKTTRKKPSAKQKKRTASKAASGGKRSASKKSRSKSKNTSGTKKTSAKKTVKSKRRKSHGRR
jgi:IMP dehydrogenase/GMP reductase